jgi:predicted TIM-barrel fold metal-dependent hydrolase
MNTRFIGFASVDPLRKGAARELERAVKKMELRGLKLDPSLQNFQPGDRRVFPVYEAAAALGIPLVIHTGMSWAFEAPLELGHPLLLEPAIRRWPTLSFVLAHFAWPWVWEATALALKYPNVYLDTACLYYDSPKEFFQFVFSKQIPTTVIERGLRNKIVFGSNYPRVEIKNMAHALKSLALTEGCLSKILRENAERLLKK